MADKFDYLDEINRDFEERMQFIKKYFPFFKICTDGSRHFNDERLKDFNIGLIIFAVLRFLVEENNFKNRGVSYREIKEYIKIFIAQTYKVYIDYDTENELMSEIYGMLTNGGQPYEYTYYDPVNAKNVTTRMVYLKAEIDPDDGVLRHYITDIGIEFYLETKEIKELNNISIQQVLLEKMVNSRNFKGARQVVRRISNQVSRLYHMKKEVLSVIGFNASEGDMLYDNFHKESMDWFEQEEDYFDNDLKLVEEARSKISLKDSEETKRDINLLNDELKQASAKYGALLNEYVDLKKKVDGIRNSRKIKVLMSTFDYRSAVEKMAKTDDGNTMSMISNPFLEPNRKKFFDFSRIDSLLKMKLEEEEEVELIEELSLEDYVFEDEMELERIDNNHNNLLRCLFAMFKGQPSFTLRGYNKVLERVFGEEIFYNGDYFSFIIALSAKLKYGVYEPEDGDNSVLDVTIENYNQIYGDAVPFELKFMADDKIELKSGFSTTNMMFRRID